MRSSTDVAVLLVLGTLAVPAAAQAPIVPSGFSSSLVAGVPAGSAGTNPAEILNPTAMQFAPDGRLFICQQKGALRVVKNGALLSAPFMTLSVSSSGERGLLGIAFDPAFTTNHYLYVYYTVPASPIHNRISRFTANGDVVVAGSEVVIMNLDNLTTATNHNGGAIRFGPDGKLYAAVGENHTPANAQSMTTRLGKILRINSDGTIPTDNPFYGSTTGANRAIWAKGLRNPFTMQFEPGTGRLYINDVGENTWEEINNGVAGANYGWSNTEGEFNAASFPTYTNPLLAYNHTGGGCALTGGAFYPTGSVNFPASYEGKYFYTDYCAGWIRTYDRIADASGAFATGLRSAVDLKVGPDQALYVLQRGSGSDTGSVYRIDYPSNVVPVVTQDPQDALVTVGSSATFTVVATGTQPLSYQWSRDGVNISGASSSSYTLINAQLSDNGATFACHVSNPSGSADSAAATLTVTNNTPPTPTIVAPSAGTQYSGGQTINYSGTGTDAEDGTEPASRLTWEVVFHHDTHTHPFLQPFSGVASGSFVIPTTGETSANVFYRIHLTVQDSGGLAQSVFRDVLPRKSNITLTTSPPGLAVKLDGQPQTAPFMVQGVVGIVRTIEATNPQTSSSTTYSFTSWSDGGAVSHNISTPATDTTYMATFQAAGQAPTVTLSATSVGPSQSIQVTVANGPGNPKDWVGLYAVSSADTMALVLAAKYLNGTATPPATGMTSAVLTFVAPSSPGSYNLRFFRNNTLTRLATSPTLTVQ